MLSSEWHPARSWLVDDLSSKHAARDTKGSYRRALVEVLAKESHCTTRAPDHSAVYNYNSASTHDISLLKKCSLSHIKTTHKIWEISSARISIIFLIDTNTRTFIARQRISHGRRASKYCKDMAQPFYTGELLLLASKFNECSTPADLDESFRTFCERFECWRADQRHQAEFFGYFWNRDLHKMARSRDELKAKQHAVIQTQPRNNTDWLIEHRNGRLAAKRTAACANPGKAKS